MNIELTNDETWMSGFTVTDTNEGVKPTLEQMQFLANLKMKKLGTPNKVYGSVARHAKDETEKIIKIYNDLDALISYFTKL